MNIDSIRQNYTEKITKVTATDMNQRIISCSRQLYKALPFTGINKIGAYFHESKGAAAWNNDQYLGSSHSFIHWFYCYFFQFCR